MNNVSTKIFHNPIDSHCSICSSSNNLSKRLYTDISGSKNTGDGRLHIFICIDKPCLICFYNTRQQLIRRRDTYSNKYSIDGHNRLFFRLILDQTNRCHFLLSHNFLEFGMPKNRQVFCIQCSLGCNTRSPKLTTSNPFSRKKVRILAAAPGSPQLFNTSMSPL